MKISSLENFKKDINNIEEYIKHIEFVNEIEENNIEDESIKQFLKHFDAFKREKKRFEHRAVIISLYGILENHINLWVKEHINNIPLILKDDSLLSPKIKDFHFKLSIDLITTILKQKNNPKYEDMDKDKILKKLNSDDFELNSEAFISSSGNLTHQKIVELFAPLEINKKKINKNLVIKKRQSTIDTLILLRNEISHGTNIAETLIDFSVYINSLKDYGEALFYILQEKEDEYQIAYEIKYEFFKIEKVHNIINNSILLFELKNNSIKIGDVIIIESSNGDLYKKEILSIEIDEVKIDKVETENRIDVGVDLTSDFNIKRNQNFYIKKREYNI